MPEQGIEPPSISDFFRCAACGKVHMRETGEVCPCGEPFPYEVKEKHYRRTDA